MPTGNNGEILSLVAGSPTWVVPGTLGATSYVVASDALTAIKTFASILQTAGYPVWVCGSTVTNVQIQAAIDA